MCPAWNWEFSLFLGVLWSFSVWHSPPPSLRNVAFCGFPPLRSPALGKEWKVFCEESSHKQISALLTMLLCQHVQSLTGNFGSRCYFGAPCNNSSMELSLLDVSLGSSPHRFPCPKGASKCKGYCINPSACLSYALRIWDTFSDESEVNLLSRLLYYFAAGPKLPEI